MLLSPGRDYKGLRSVEWMEAFNVPVYLAASQEDAEPFSASQLLYRIAKPKKSIRLFKNVGHGTTMLRNYPGIKADMIQWIHGIVPGDPPELKLPQAEAVPAGHQAGHQASHAPELPTPKDHTEPAQHVVEDATAGSQEAHAGFTPLKTEKLTHTPAAHAPSSPSPASDAKHSADQATKTNPPDAAHATEHH